jgi:hypothetical protein
MMDASSGAGGPGLRVPALLLLLDSAPPGLHLSQATRVVLGVPAPLQDTSPSAVSAGQCTLLDTAPTSTGSVLRVPALPCDSIQMKQRARLPQGCWLTCLRQWRLCWYRVLCCRHLQAANMTSQSQRQCWWGYASALAPKRMISSVTCSRLQLLLMPMTAISSRAMRC